MFSLSQTFVVVLFLSFITVVLFRSLLVVLLRPFRLLCSEIFWLFCWGHFGCSVPTLFSCSVSALFVVLFDPFRCPVRPFLLFWSDLFGSFVLVLLIVLFLPFFYLFVCFVSTHSCYSVPTLYGPVYCFASRRGAINFRRYTRHLELFTYHI